MGEAILELGRQYSVEESRHIISISFPHQQSPWVNIWGLKWHFCNSTAHNGSFVILSGRGDMTTKLGLHGEDQPLHHLQPLFKTSIFVLQASVDVPFAVFHVFGSFLPFLCIFDSTHWGFYVWNSFSGWAVRFVDFIDLEQYPFMGFSHLYMITLFCIPFKLWNLNFCS